MKFIKFTIYTLTFLISLGFVSYAHGASVTVCDTGNGCDYTTIAAAINAVTTGTANTITVNSPYSGNERVTVDKAGASDANRLIIIADSGYTPITKGFSVTANYVTVDGFEMANCGTVYCADIAADYVSILNNDIHDNTGSSLVGQSNETDIERNYAIVQGNKIHTPSEGKQIIYTICSHCLFDSNEIYDAENADAFYFWGHDSVISNNYIHDLYITSGTGNHSDFFQTLGDGGPSINYNWIIENNMCISPGTTGVDENGICLYADGTCGDGQPFNLSNDGQAGIHDITFRNNIFVGFGTQGNIGVPNTYIYNNVFINCSWININGAISFFYGGGWDDTGDIVKNNLFIQAYDSFPIDADARVTHSNNYVSRYSVGPLAWHTITGWSETGGVYGGNPNLASLTPAACPGDWSPTSYCTAMPCGTFNWTTHKCSNFDFSLQSSSPTKDAGATLTGFLIDRDGITRPQGSAWDIGAYEYAEAASDIVAPAAPSGLSVS